MSEFDSILVATDFSDISGDAFTKAVGLARQLNAQLHIVHIVQIHPANMPQSGNVNVDELEALEEKSAGDSLQKVLDEQCQGIDVKTHILHGDPAEQVMQTAKEFGVDIIVMGTHGRTGLSHLIMGSVAESVIKNSKTPVLCVKSG